jgi:hypothetical protein
LNRAIDGRYLNKLNFKGGFWPTRHQKLLLQACLLQGEEALDAWYKWKSTTDIDQLDRGSLRLIPMLYRNLQVHGVEDNLMNKFKGGYRFTLYKNHMLLHNMANVLARFYDAGLHVMVLKGVALTLLYYRDYGLRPMEDFDILIHEKDVAKAINILRELGWKPWQRLPKVLTEEYLSSTKGCKFNNHRGEGLDLHWHVLLESCYKNADKDFWNGAVKTSIHDYTVYALNPADQLLHACVHGSMRSTTPTIRWVADAALIMKSSQAEIDWDRLMVQASKRRLVLPLENTMRYLQDFLSLSIPPEVLKQLRASPVSKTERMENAIRTRYPVFIVLVMKEWFCYLRNAQLVSGAKLHPQIIGFPKYLRHSLFLNHLWQVPFYATFRFIRLFLRMMVHRSKLSHL